jgi:hypothetical protein
MLAALPPLGGSPLLADISVEVIFFLVATIIALVNKLYEKSRQVRAKSKKQQRAKEGRERLEFVRAGAEVVEAPVEPKAPEPQSIVVRPMRERKVRPPRRTTRTIVPVAAPPMRRHVRTSAAESASNLAERLRRDRNALREAVLLREILGPPVAMRGYRFPRR